MEKGSSSRAFSYVLLLAGIILILFSLDRIFGLTYHPNEHRLNQDQEQEEGHGQLHQQPETKTAPTKKPKVAQPETVKKEKTSEQPEVQQAAISDEDFFTSLKDQYTVEVLRPLGDNKSRTDVVLRYYRHPPDGNSAYELEKLGFHIHERPVNPEHESYQSNSIAYGNQVALRDIQLVAATLLKNGIPLKVIKPSKFGDDWKANSIEIGTDPALINQPNLTLSDIQQFVR